MTRTMGDAIADNVPALAQVSGLQLVAGYVTGTPDILWTAADWAEFPGLPQVTIDQGYTGSPVPSAIVRDVEEGAWTAANAVNMSDWTPVRPTIYCDQSDLTGVLAAGWQGDLWLAIPGWVTGQALPTAPGCTVVAVQNQPDAGNGAYDLSVVLDPYWPLEADMAGATTLQAIGWCHKCDCMVGIPAAGSTPCAAGGNHDLSQSYTYWVGTDGQIIASS